MCQQATIQESGDNKQQYKKVVISAMTMKQAMNCHNNETLSSFKMLQYLLEKSLEFNHLPRWEKSKATLALKELMN